MSTQPQAVGRARRPSDRRRRLQLARLRGRRGYVLLCQLLILAVFLGLWEYATAWNKQAAFLFGSPSAIGGFLVKMWQDGSLVRDTWVTGLETILGFLVGNVLGTVLGPVLVVLALRLARGAALHRGPRLDPDHRPGARS